MGILVYIYIYIYIYIYTGLLQSCYGLAIEFLNPLPHRDSLACFWYGPSDFDLSKVIWRGIVLAPSSDPYQRPRNGGLGIPDLESH